MRETEHYKFKKPEDTDYVRVSDLNGNADAIDAKLHELATEVTPIARGGTGATDAAAARANLNVHSKAEIETALSDLQSAILKAQTLLGAIGTVPVANGGTGATNAADARTNLGLGNVENKSSSTIRGELTKANVTSALGYTPPSSDKNTTYSLSQDSSDGHKLTLTGSDGTSKTVTVPDSDTKALGSMTGTLGVSHGGTGKTTADEAWTALGGGSIGKKSSLAASDIPSLDTSKIGSGTFGVARGGTGVTSAQAERKRLGLGDTTGAVPVANGGTGATTAAAARTNLGVTAANVVGNQAIAPASVAATGAVSGSSVSDSVGSLADLRDSVSLRFGMQSASSLGLTSPANDNLDWYWNNFGRGLHAFWIDGNGKVTNQPHGWGNMLMFIFTNSDMCQIYIDTRSKVNLRLSDSSTRTWNAWTALN